MEQGVVCMLCWYRWKLFWGEDWSWQWFYGTVSTWRHAKYGYVSVFVRVNDDSIVFLWDFSLWPGQLLESQQISRSKVKSQGRIFLFFTIARQDKKSVYTITHEPRHSLWWHSAETCTPTSARNPENFKVMGQRWRSHGVFMFFCVQATQLLTDLT